MLELMLIIQGYIITNVIFDGTNIPRLLWNIHNLRKYYFTFPPSTLEIITVSDSPVSHALHCTGRSLVCATVVIHVTGVCWKVASCLGMSWYAASWQVGSNMHCANSLGICVLQIWKRHLVIIWHREADWKGQFVLSQQSSWLVRDQIWL